MDNIDVPQALQRLVVKQGLSLGGLSAAQRQQALTLVWAGLPDTVLTEAAVNTRLKAALAGSARCLDTDHVELRRWLVDGGWVARDGFGRAYQRVPAAALPVQVCALARVLDGIDGAAFTAHCLAAEARRREAARQAWAAQAR